MPVPPAPPNRTALQLSLLFAAVYFIQGISEPSEGLIAQPVRSLLRDSGHSVREIGWFMAILGIPWMIKPLYGLLTDLVPLFSYRRRSYLAAATLTTVFGLSYFAIAAPEKVSIGQMLFWLLPATVGVAFTDVVADALMVEEGQPRGLTGRLQSVQWTAIYTASILAGTLGGYLSQHGLEHHGFLICAAVTSLTFFLALFFVHEQPLPAGHAPVQEMVQGLRELVRNKNLLAVAAFLFLWCFNPFSSTLRQLHLTGAMGYSEQFYGHLVSVQAIASVVGSIAYGFYCRRVPFPWLVRASVVLGVVSTLAYGALAGPRSAVVISAVVGFTYMTAFLIQLDLAARVCPPRLAGTLFAVLMSLCNLSDSLATALGGELYEKIAINSGTTVAYQVLVLIGAIFTGGCAFLLPFFKEPEVPADMTNPADLSAGEAGSEAASPRDGSI